MKKLALFVVLLLLPLLMGGHCGKSVVRDSKTYQTEIGFMELTSNTLAGHLKKWITAECKCTDGKFTTDLCQKSAKDVLVVEARVPWHKKMMLFNAGITDKRPDKAPPLLMTKDQKFTVLP